MDRETIRQKVEKHPCYCAGAHMKYSRIHLPVAPACNIQCNYCNRKFDCSNESRPGVTSDVLTPEQALEKTISAYHAVENLSVAGIAGPGDALANPEETFGTFRLIKEFNPDIKLCLSTNGLALPKYVDQIAELGIEHVTVTMNAVDPEIAVKIYDNVGGERGIEAVKKLIGNQILGIRMLVAENVIVKVNSVLIPGINDEHIAEVAETIKELGAYIHNVIPLMSKKEYGTKFSEMEIPEPDCAMLAKVRNDCEDAMGSSENIMSHCRQCRADAVGKLGSVSKIGDLSLDEHSRTHSGAVFGRLNELAVADVRAGIADMKDFLRGRTVRVAVASSTGRCLDSNFGKAGRFEIYAFTEEGFEHEGTFDLASAVASSPETRLDARTNAIINGLGTCHAAVFRKIGNSAAEEMRNLGIVPFAGTAYSVCLKEAWKAAEKIIAPENAEVKK
ncbi:MAG: nitrogenase cofactor biosynthesis protein NifB [Deferribacterales bacterium]